MKFSFLHIKFNEVGTTLKHPRIIDGNVKKDRKGKIKKHINFYFKNLILAVMASKFQQKIKSEK
jgi:hypothetical protein